MRTRYGVRAGSVGMALTFALALPVTVATPVMAAPSDQDVVEDRRDAVLEARQQATVRLDETTAALAELGAALNQAESAVVANRAALDAARVKVADARAQDIEIAGRLAVAEEQEQVATGALEQAREERARALVDVGRSAREAYTGAQTSTAVEIVLGSATVEDLATRSSLLDRLGKLQGDAVARAELTGAQAASAQARRTAVRQLVQDLRQQAQDNLDRARAAEVAQDRLAREAETLAEQRQALVAEAAAQRDAEVARIDALEQEADALQVEMDRLAREAAERAAREQAEREREAARRAAQEQADRERTAAEHAAADRARSQTSREHRDAGPAPAVPVASPAARPDASGLLRPVSGRVTSSYGWRVHPVYGTRRLHRGTDFGNGCGTPVRAAASGTVSSAAAAGSAGNRIILDHGVVSGRSTGTVYMHLQGFAVRSGQSVSRGDVIGYVGTTGASTGCHLHFEVYEGGKPIDPMTRL